MTRNEIGAYVREILNSYGEGDLPDEGDVVLADLNLDSVDYLEVILRIEEKFDQEIEVADFERCKTLDEVIDFLDNRLAP
tara:strand:+ start:639 stop:878 length:240 start_codon:yes stop_codon:yes gene_type:complete